MIKGKIGVLIEDHFDQTEFEKFNEFFPENGYQIDYISHLWGNSELHFDANADEGVIRSHVTVNIEVDNVDPYEYKAFILIGAYAMDRLRYQTEVYAGKKNDAPAVNFLRQILNIKGLKVGTICHSLWLFCADRELIEGRKVTCAHNIICDVENAGGIVIYENNQTADLVIDGDLITAKHPGVTDLFNRTLIEEIEKAEV
jgi:putative intracellular protease/amidase